jgi:hypothetical protein
MNRVDQLAEWARRIEQAGGFDDRTGEESWDSWALLAVVREIRQAWADAIHEEASQ